METMLRYHMAVVTPDKRLKRAIKRVTTATASTATFAPDFAQLATDERVDMAIVDARSQRPANKELSVVPNDASIAYILDEENLIQIVDMLADERVSSLLCHDDAFDDDEFIASATKALRRDIFGLQKYFPWGVTTYSMVIHNYEQKTRAIEIIMDYARQAGLRGPVRDRVQLVSDELMMNGLYHAPVDEDGNELYRNVSRKELTKLEQVSPIEVHYGCSGRYFGLSVRDGGGSLTREKALEYLIRAKNATAQIETKAAGAGLGLISVLRSVSKLIFNLDPGHSTEVIALFDMNQFARGKVGARSLHVFMADEDSPQELFDEGAEAVIDGGSESNPWPLIALLLGLLAVAMGITYFLSDQRKTPAAAQVSEADSVIIIPTPADALITVGGSPHESGVEIPIPEGVDSLEVVVSKPGYQTWKRRVTRSRGPGVTRLHVELARRPR